MFHPLPYCFSNFFIMWNKKVSFYLFVIIHSSQPQVSNQICHKFDDIILQETQKATLIHVNDFNPGANMPFYWYIKLHLKLFATQSYYMALKDLKYCKVAQTMNNAATIYDKF